jgi:general secretion pathway protein F
MPSYHYEAADATGQIERGMLDANSPRGARAGALRYQETGRATSAASALFAKRLNDSDLGWLTRQIASLLVARLPLDAALSATLEQTEKRHVCHALAAVRADVRAGHRLAQALAARPGNFPEIYRALVAAGEESGDLAQVMEKLADYIEARSAFTWQGVDCVYLSRHRCTGLGGHRIFSVRVCRAEGGECF